MRVQVGLPLPTITIRMVHLAPHELRQVMRIIEVLEREVNPSIAPEIPVATIAQRLMTAQAEVHQEPVFLAQQPHLPGAIQPHPLLEARILEWEIAPRWEVAHVRVAPTHLHPQVP